MKSYPEIPHINKSEHGQQIIAFNKIDGSNLRFEWNKKKSWYKFGSRNCMIDETHPDLGAGITLFLKKYGSKLDNMFRTEKDFRNVQEFVAFAEFFGNNSFAGRHEIDDIKDVVLFDISVYKKGMIFPKDLIKLSEKYDFEIPPVVYNGSLNATLIDWVKHHKFLSEGVVCKWIDGKQVKMTKIKTLVWLRRLKELYNEMDE